jgi:hypothetical protein
LTTAWVKLTRDATLNIETYAGRGLSIDMVYDYLAGCNGYFRVFAFDGGATLVRVEPRFW